MIEKTKYILGHEKDALKHDEVYKFRPAKKLYYPLLNPRCKTAEVKVEVGANVGVGEVLGIRNGGFFTQPILSTVSGKYLGIEKKYDSTDNQVDYLVVENDMKNTNAAGVKKRADTELLTLSKDKIVEIIKDKAVVGLGGSGFPTYIKLQTTEPIAKVLVNGIECEPYLVSDYQLMMTKAEEIILGLSYVMKSVGAPAGEICIKKKYVDVKAHLEEVLTQKFSDFGITVNCVENYYPQGWELKMIEEASDIKVPIGTLPSKFGIIPINVTTCQAVYHAIVLDLPLRNRIFSFCGDGVENKNYEVLIGTPLRELIEELGGFLTDEHVTDVDKKVLILGGPMMGSCITNLDQVINPTVTSLLVLNETPVVENPCLRCGSCIYSCPAKLSPVLIMNAYKVKDKDALKGLGTMKCIECGMCSYTCPSKIDLTNFLRLAKRLAK